MDPDAYTDKFRQWADRKSTVTRLTREMNVLRDDLMKVVIQDGDSDELGSRRWYFPASVDIDGTAYKGIKREARTSTVVNEERALKLAEAEGLEDELVVQVRTIDVDALYRVYAEGRVSQDQLDSLFDTKVTHAFKPVVE